MGGCLFGEAVSVPEEKESTCHFGPWDPRSDSAQGGVNAGVSYRSFFPWHWALVSTAGEPAEDVSPLCRCPTDSEGQGFSQGRRAALCLNLHGLMRVKLSFKNATNTAFQIPGLQENT